MAAGSVARALLNYAECGLLALDERGQIMFANSAAHGLLGLEPRQGSHAGPATVEAALAGALRLSPVGRSELMQLVRGQRSSPLHITAQDGAAMNVSCHTEPGGPTLVAIAPGGPVAQVPESTDPLTGLADRDCFYCRLAAICTTERQPIVVIRVDLDRFRTVNETLGHVAGDALLRLVAQRLRGVVRHADIVSRFEGGAFAIAMAASPGINDLVDRLVSVLSRPYLVDRQTAVIGANVGMAFGPLHGTTSVDLVRAADLALRQSKSGGAGTVRCYDDALGARVRTSLALSDDLSRAIPLQQFELHYQPQVSLETRKLTGFEALIRWRHPERGMVGPNQFIPLAEESGLIVAIGEWVLIEACREAARWDAELTVAVNVAASQLFDKRRFPRTIAAALEITGLAPSRLEIEITESALVREAEAFEVLAEVQAMGVRVSMDDFGTGYSSLSQLRRFPFNKLKIDQSFVRDLGDGGQADAVVRAILTLGHSLGMVTVAEGVETAHQEELCRIGGCSSMQGYFISKPVPAGEVPALIKRLT